MADLDGSGRLDLVAARNPQDGSRAEAPTVVYRNDGGQLSQAATLVSDRGARAVTVLDADGDGRLDLFVAGSNRLFVNQGDGTFKEADAGVFAWAVHGEEDDVAGVAIADLTRDGRPDIVLGQHYNSTLEAGARVPVHIYLNQGVDGGGDPVFRDVTAEAGLPGLATKAPHVELADLDNDGWPDLITSASAAGGSQPAVFRHEGLMDGIPRFRTPEGLGDAQYWVNGGAADLTRDGRLDLLLVEWYPEEPTRVFANDSPAWTIATHCLESARSPPRSATRPAVLRSSTSASRPPTLWTFASTSRAHRSPRSCAPYPQTDTSARRGLSTWLMSLAKPSTTTRRCLRA